jgi:zinc protease
MTSPSIDTRWLANGLRVVLARDARVPVVSVSVTYAVGSAQEAPGRSGFAHLFEHMMFQGSANIGKGEHLRTVEAAGGEAGASTGWDSTVYIDTMPSHQLELALWMEADRLATLSTTISQEALDNQREVVKNERREWVDNLPYGPAEDELFGLALPPAHPYAHSLWGSMDDLEAASLADVQAFFTTHYVPNNATLTLAGDFEADAALAMVERHFGPIPPGSAVPAKVDAGAGSVLPGPIGSVRQETTRDVPIPRLFVAFPVPQFGTRDWDVADLVADLLIRGRASRLQRRLIRELRLADSVDASAYPLVTGTALLEIDATASTGADPLEVEAALSAELDGLATEPPDDEELARVYLGRATDHAVTMQEAAQRAERIGMYACLLDEPERFGREGEHDRAIGPDAIRDFARNALSAENRALLWYLPESD